MKGTLTIIKADGATVATELDRKVSLEELQKAVGGYFEIVPHFDRYNGQRCMAFANEYGKLKHMRLPVNLAASEVWQRMNDYRIPDFLVGDIAIVQGDAAFMSEL